MIIKPKVNIGEFKTEVSNPWGYEASPQPINPLLANLIARGQLQNALALQYSVPSYVRENASNAISLGSIPAGIPWSVSSSYPSQSYNPFGYSGGSSYSPNTGWNWPQTGLPYTQHGGSSGTFTFNWQPLLWR